MTISWTSSKQKLVTLSSCEAEYMAVELIIYLLVKRD